MACRKTVILIRLNLMLQDHMPQHMYIKKAAHISSFFDN
jgi:hypothetical protein